MPFPRTLCDLELASHDDVMSLKLVNRLHVKEISLQLQIYKSGSNMLISLLYKGVYH